MFYYKILLLLSNKKNISQKKKFKTNISNLVIIIFTYVNLLFIFHTFCSRPDSPPNFS